MQDSYPPYGTKTNEKMIRIDGLDQIVDMLYVADQDFRNSILKNIAKRDKELAENLQKKIYQKSRSYGFLK